MHPPVAPAAPSVLALYGKGSIACGALSFAVHTLAARRLDVTVVACPNASDKGYDTWEGSLRRAARLLGVPCVPPDAMEGEPGLLLVSLEYDRLIRVERFRSRRLYNIHFSALPKYRGVFTSIWPIMNDEQCSGVTLHEIDAGIDTGPIVAQRQFAIPPDCTARRLYDLYLDEGLRLFKACFGALLDGVPEATPQDASEASYYSRKSIDLTDRSIDLRRSAEAVSRFARALAFPEYQLPRLGDRAVRGASVLPDVSTEPPGTCVSDTPYSGAFVAGDGRLIELVWA